MAEIIAPVGFATSPRNGAGAQNLRLQLKNAAQVKNRRLAIGRTEGNRVGGYNTSQDMATVNSSGAAALLGPVWSPPEEFDEFRLVRPLGGGAMGQVYLAHDTLLDRPVAVKFMHGAIDPEARARVLDEGRAIARLQHPN